jgi:serine/threonine protein kinase
MQAKLADFGFSIELPKLSHGLTMFTSQALAHTEGYYPSEITCGKFSDRSDVFSFGIVSSFESGIVWSCCGL